MNFQGHPECKVKIFIAVDKKGSYAKFHSKIAAPDFVKVAQNVYIFSMFEAFIPPKSMLKVLGPEDEQIKYMNTEILNWLIEG